MLTVNGHKRSNCTQTAANVSCSGNSPDNRNNNSSSSSSNGVLDKSEDARIVLVNEKGNFTKDDRPINSTNNSSRVVAPSDITSQNSGSDMQGVSVPQLSLRNSTMPTNNTSISGKNIATSPSNNSGSVVSNRNLNSPPNSHNINNNSSQKLGSRRIFTPQFKLQVLESYRNDADCKGNQRATARKYNIHRRQIQKWLQCESNLRSSVANLNNQQGNKNNNTSTTNSTAYNNHSNGSAVMQHQFHNIEMTSQHHNHYSHRFPAAITLAGASSPVSSAPSSSTAGASSNRRNMFVGAPPPSPHYHSHVQQQQHHHHQQHHHSPLMMLPIAKAITSENGKIQQEQDQCLITAAVATTLDTGCNANSHTQTTDTVNSAISSNSNIKGMPLRPAAVGAAGSINSGAILDVCHAQPGRLPTLHMPQFELTAPSSSPYPVNNKPFAFFGVPHHQFSAHHHHAQPHTHLQMAHHQKHHHPYATYYDHLSHQVPAVIGCHVAHHSSPTSPYHQPFQPSAFMSPAFSVALSHAAMGLPAPHSNPQCYSKEVPQKMTISTVLPLSTTSTSLAETKAATTSLSLPNSKDDTLKMKADCEDSQSPNNHFLASKKDDYIYVGETSAYAKGRCNTSGEMTHSKMRGDDNNGSRECAPKDCSQDRMDTMLIERITTSLPIDLSLGHRRDVFSIATNEAKISSSASQCKTNDSEENLQSGTSFSAIVDFNKEQHGNTSITDNLTSPNTYYDQSGNTNVVDLSYRKRKVTSDNHDHETEASTTGSAQLRSSAELPDKLCKFSNSNEEISKNIPCSINKKYEEDKTVDVKSKVVDEDNGEIDDNDEDVDVEIDVRNADTIGSNEDIDADEMGRVKMEMVAAHQPSKPVKLFKPYLLDENEETRSSSSSCSSSVTQQQPPLAPPPPHPVSNQLDTFQNSFPVVSCLQVGGSSNQLPLPRTNSVSPTAASAFSPTTSMAALSPTCTELRCFKESTIQSGYESSSSSGHSETSSSSSTSAIVLNSTGNSGGTFLYNNRTYSLNLHMQQLYTDSHAELFPTSDNALHLDRWLEQDIANMPPSTSSSIALYA